MQQHPRSRALRGVRHAALPVLLVLVAACSDPVSSGTRGDPPPDPLALAQVPPAVLAAYQEDAVRLAIRELAAANSPARNEVEPPAALVSSLLSAMVAVHAMRHSARDAVVELYSIHTFPHPATWEIMVRVDPAHEWTQAWRGRNALTGNAAVDALVNAYGLQVREFYLWSIGDVAVLRASRPLNAAALATRFEGIPGVVWAEQNGAGGDGNDIRATRTPDGWRLDYSVGWGDCPAGCIQRHTWVFAVSGGAARYVGSNGPPPPAAR